MTQEDLAEKSGMSISFLKDIERGVGFGTPATLDRIAEALGVTPGELFESERPPAPVSVVITRIMAIPDPVYELAIKVGAESKVWGNVQKLLEYEISMLEREQKKKAKQA